MMIDPRTPEGRMTLRYRGYRTEVILKELVSRTVQ